MPSKNIVKEYHPNSFYHIYNRGVNKTEIFLDEQDYSVLLSYLKTYLIPFDLKILERRLTDKELSEKEKKEALNQINRKNFHGKIELIAYCLMPNHYHFLIRQENKYDMKEFIQTLMALYVKYFNSRHSRIGPLFQGKYKAVLIDKGQLAYLSRYIHRNPIEGSKIKRSDLNTLDPYLRQPSSFPNYIRQINQVWVKPDYALDNFSQDGFNSYRDFVQSTDKEFEEKFTKSISKLSLDQDV